MNRPARPVLSLALCLAFSLVPAAASGPWDALAQAQGTDAPKKTSRTAATQKKGTGQKAPRAGASDAEALLGRQKLTRQDLASPYTATAGYGPPAPERPAEDNATSLDFDPQPDTGPFAGPKKGPFATPKDSPINLRFGSDKITDPITGLEVNPKGGSSGGREPAKSEIKGALEKVGGKAEVQVDIFKF